ncbi:ABC transporter ATP-binding protein [Gryllotalpicola reticulitermitis]|uniref:ABC transporter ATP-binding protein n=1 Tax=Gryllotalpicola reticulitermitis TaxID=1184153 RepID=A0ABV8Q3F8_9MICO
MPEEIMLEARDIAVLFNQSKGFARIFGGARRSDSALHALDGVSLSLRRGESLALVGESGSGKSTFANVLVGRLAPAAGQVHFEGEHIGAERSISHRRRIQMVFQDPYSSLNPRMTVRRAIGELLRVHRIVPPSEIDAELVRLVNLVGLDEEVLDAYPGQFSGGQRQRLAIARALAVRPDILVADEPVSALDVSVQATVLNLISELQRELGLSVLFIGHNLSVVRSLCQRVAVMYLGRIVEVADVDEIFDNPKHPYTRALIASIPRMHRTIEREPAIQGDPPSPINLPVGCRFQSRCPLVQDRCRAEDPALRLVSATPTAGGEFEDHLSACHYAEELV